MFFFVFLGWFGGFAQLILFLIIYVNYGEILQPDKLTAFLRITYSLTDIITEIPDKVANVQDVMVSEKRIRALFRMEENSEQVIICKTSKVAY